MRNRSPANNAASSPPVPARISSIAGRSSAVSRGSKATAKACSASAMSWLISISSSTAMSLSSASPCGSRAMICSVSTSARKRRTVFAAIATGSSSEYSLDAVTNASPTICPVAIRASSSANRDSICAIRCGEIFILTSHPNPFCHSRERGNPWSYLQLSARFLFAQRR